MTDRSVLHVTQPVDAGVAAVVLGLLDDQARRGWRVMVACPPTGDLPERARGAGHEVIDWPAAREPGRHTVREIWRLSRIVRANRPDLIHLHSSKAGLVGRLAVRGGRPTVFQPHAWSFLAVGGRQSDLALRWERLATRWCDRLIAVSVAERSLAAEAGIDVTRARVVHNGVDTDKYQPVGVARVAELRRDLAVGDGPLVVCVGRLCGQKGQDTLLQSWPAVRGAVPDAELVLVGDGPQRDDLTASAPDGVTFAGATDRVADWLAASNVVAAPSRWEGQSLALLEAMASGASIVATDVAGVRESLGDHGGDVVAIGDVDALARGIVARLTDGALAASEGVANRRRAVDEFARETTMAKMAAVYDEIWGPGAATSR